MFFKRGREGEETAIGEHAAGWEGMVEHLANEKKARPREDAIERTRKSSDQHSDGRIRFSSQKQKKNNS